MERKYIVLNIILFYCVTHCLGFTLQDVVNRKSAATICDSVEISVQDKVENRIDDKIYGFLLEHIYHSVSNGIWGENVWNRSFEELSAYGDWKINDNRRVLLNATGKPLAYFRICKGKDYELNLELNRLKGRGPVLISMRDQSRDNMETNSIRCYLGADSNSSHKLELNTGWVWYNPKVKSVIADAIPGGLDVGEWVKIRLLCSKGHFTAWINGKKIFDREIVNCPSDGDIVIGGKDCCAEFRNISVKSLDDDNIPLNLNPVCHWNLVGHGEIEVIHSNVLNQDCALHIHSFGREAGIEQIANFSILKDDLLKGSLYLRGTVTNACIRIESDGNIISEQALHDITRQWKQFRVELPSSVDVSKATLRISTKDKGDLYIDQISLMNQSSIENQGFRVNLTKAVSDIKPTILRWPGGSFSEQYHFEDGLGNQNKRKGILKWEDFDPLSFGTDEFISFCHKVGAEPQIVVPIGYHNYKGYVMNEEGKHYWLQKALDWMDYCNGDNTTKWGQRRIKNGHIEPYDVKYWEIDNEVWKMDPELYAEIVRSFSTEMKKKYPNIKIIGCGCGRLGREGVGLDSILINKAAPYIDYISPHYYQTINKFGNEGVEEYGQYLDKLSEWISKSKNPEMKIYLSEWNLDGIDMRTGLFAGGFLNRLERTPKLDMAAAALFLRDTSATGWNNAFINFNQSGWFPAPNYVVFKLWRDSYLPNHISISGNTKGLNIVATASDDKNLICIKVVNPSNKCFKLIVKNRGNYNNISCKKVCVTSLEDKDSMSEPDKIKVEEGDFIQNEEGIDLMIPAFSASVLSMHK